MNNSSPRSSCCGDSLITAGTSADAGTREWKAEKMSEASVKEEEGKGQRVARAVCCVPNVIAAQLGLL